MLGHSFFHMNTSNYILKENSCWNSNWNYIAYIYNSGKTDFLVFRASIQGHSKSFHLFKSYFMFN